jgi:DNA processing protein
MSVALKPSLAEMPLLDVLQLFRTPQVGTVTFFTLIERYGTAAKALEMLPELSRRGGRAEPLKPPTRALVEGEVAAVQKFGAKLVVYGSASYPELLHLVPDPPPVITVLGHDSVWQNKPLISVVGARNASANGCAFAKTLSENLGKAGYTVVSGLARGIDTFVHKATLATGTVAVVAGGIDRIYPPENAALFQQIRETGAIISEQPFGMTPFSTAFPSRNRIIAGMTHGCVIVEAAVKSGSLITARLAVSYDREVFAVPGSPMDPRAQGCNKLLKDGAHLVETADDIIQVLKTFTGRVLLREHLLAPAFAGGEAVDLPEAEGAKLRAAVLEKISFSPASIDLLIELTGVPPNVLQGVLLELELAEKIRRLPGGLLALRAS